MNKAFVLVALGAVFSLFAFACSNNSLPESSTSSYYTMGKPMHTNTPTSTATNTPVNTATRTATKTATNTMTSTATNTPTVVCASQNVLIISTGNLFIDTDLKNALICDGASVTVLDVTVCSSPVYSALTAAGLTLSQFDQVWDVRWTASGCTALTGPATTPNTDENLYQDFLANHGSIYMNFEYFDANRYNSVIDFLNTVVSQTPVFTTQLGGSGPSWYLNVPGAVQAENFDTNCKTLSTAPGAIQTNGDGSLPITQCGSGSPLYLNTASAVGYGPGELVFAEAWTGSQMQAAVSNGKVMIMGDREFYEVLSGTCPGSSENDFFIQNALKFLVKD